MSNVNIRTRLAQILGVEDSPAWEVVDSISEKGLYMVHYRPDADMSRFGHLRGIVVDAIAGTMVCQSFGFTRTVVAPQYLVPQPDGVLRLNDTTGLPLEIPVDASFAIKLGFEGTVVRVFKHRGVVYRATHRRLDITNSRWGQSKTFLEMYAELGGPSDDELFNPLSAYSPFCHIFLLVHPDVLVATKQQVGPGYIAYLGARQMWTTDYASCPYKQTPAEGGLFVPVAEFEADPRPDAGFIDPTLRAPESRDTFPEVITTPFLYAPRNISFEEANHHLQFGFYAPYELAGDARTLPGESVMIYTGDQLVKVQSWSYTFRVDMRNNDPNLAHQFFALISGSYIDTATQEGFARYLQRFPLYTPFSQSSLRETIIQNGPLVAWPQDSNALMNPMIVSTKDDRLYNIFIAYLMAVPLHRQLEVIDIYERFILERGSVVDWLNMVAANADPTIEVSARARQIVTLARTGAEKRVDRGDVLSRRGKPLTFQEMVRDNIRNLISKEEGTSLYRLVRAMKQSRETPAAAVGPLTVADFLPKSA